MKHKNSMLGLATAGLLLTAANVNAAFVNYSDSLGDTTTEWTHNFSLPEFNPALGTLTSVVISASQDVAVSGTVTNTAITTQSFTFRAGSQLTLNLPGSLGTLEPLPLGSTSSYTLSAGDSASYGPFTHTASDSQTFTAALDMALFEGTGNLTLPGTTASQEVISGGGGNISAALTTLSGAVVSVTYNYTAIPEPSSMGSLACLVGTGMFLRVRRRK